MTPRTSFILRFGVLGYGSGIFFLFNLLHIARLHAHGASLRGLPVLLLITAIVSPMVGYCFGTLAWRRQRTRS